MAAAYTSLELLTKLKGPYKDTDQTDDTVVPGWTKGTDSDGKVIWTAANPSVVRYTRPSTASITGFEDFVAAISMTELEWREFYGVVFTSLDEIELLGATQQERDDYLASVRTTLQETLAIIQDARATRDRISSLPPSRSEGESPRVQFSRGLASRVFSATTYIGPIVIDPEINVVEVEIKEDYGFNSLRTLRGVTDPVLKNHKNDIVMSMTLEYPQHLLNDVTGVEGVERFGLRSLLATLKAAPVCEISSTAIVPVFVNGVLTPEVFDELKDNIGTNLLGGPAGLKQRRENTSKALSIATKDATSLDAFRDFVGSLDPVLDFLSEPASKDEIGVDQRQLEALQGTSTTLVKESLKRGKHSVTVPCAFQGAVIRTKPNNVNTILVKLLFYRYNDTAWQRGKIMYRDINGEPTTDPFLCPWITRMANIMFFDNRKIGIDYMQPYTIPKEGEAGIEFEWNDTLTPNTLRYVPDHKQFVLEDVELRVFMKVAKLPLLGSSYPVVQYMGIDNIQARVTFTITDPVELAKFHEMKAELDTINYGEGEAYKRRQHVTITNNVLNFAGAQDFIIVGITTTADNRHDRWHVEMSVVESRVSVAGVEQLVLADQNTREISDLKSIWMHMYDLLSEKAVGPDGKEMYKSLPVDPEHPRSWELDKEGQAAHALIYGKDQAGLSSLIHPNMMAAAWYYRTQLGKPRDPNAVRGTQNTIKNVRWDTSWANDKQVAGVTEGKGLVGGWEGLSSLFGNDRDLERIPTPLSGFLGGRVVSAAYVPGADGTRHIEAVIIKESHNPVAMFDVVVINDGTQKQTYDDLETRAFNFLSKGQYDLDDRFWDTSSFSNFVEGFGALSAEILINVGGQTAKHNVFTQGRDLLAWLSITGRKRTFFTRTFWQDYFNVVMNSKVRPDLAEEPIWSDRELNRARTNIMMLSRAGGFSKFPKWRAKHGMQSLDDGMRGVRVSNPKSQEKTEYHAAVNNYADMRLPSYASLFSENGQKMLVKDGKETIELWRKFAPTYSDLGKKPPFTRSVAFTNMEDAVNQIARVENDPVDPTVCYYHEKRKPTVVAAAMEKQDNSDRNIEAIRSKTIIVPTERVEQGGSAIGRWLEEVYSDPSDRQDELAYGKDRENTLLKALDRNTDVKDRRQSIVLISQEGEPLGTVTAGSKGINPVVFNKFERGEGYKIFNGAGMDVFDGYDTNHVAKTNLDLTSRVPDMNLNMMRLFPAYRLFFIEEDRERLWMTDDLYGSNAVVSMSLRVDKWDAALLTVNISNITNNLSQERTLSPETTEKLGLIGDEEGEPYFSKLKLQSGVKVQLRLGYGALPADLPIVFTGIITEITPGKMVQFVAQGHKRELLNEVQFDYSGINHFDIIRKCFEKTEHPNLGETVKAKDIGTAMAPHLFPNNTDPREMVGVFDRLFNEEYSTVTRNIYINSNSPQEITRRTYFTAENVQPPTSALGAGGRLLANASPLLGAAFGDAPQDRAVRAGIESTARWMGIDLWGLIPDMFSQPTTESGHWAEWVVPPQPAWDAINEVARHRPGHIVQVVPYETKGTVFMGQPEQPYLAERPSYREELAYARLGRLMSTASRVDFHNEVLGPFLSGDPWYSVYQAHWAADPRGSSNRQAASFVRDAYNASGFFSDKDIYSNVSDANIFVRGEDIMQLEDMPDPDDKARVVAALKDEDFEKLALKYISQAAGGNLPPNFSVEVDWWVYANEMKQEWDWLQSFDNALIEELFYWYFDMNPDQAKLVLGPQWRDIRQFIWHAPESGIFKHAVENLDETDNGGVARNSSFSVPYSLVHAIARTPQQSTPVMGGEIEEINIMEERGLLSEERAERLRTQAQLFAQDAVDAASGLRPPATRLGLRPRGSYPDPPYVKMQDILSAGGSVNEVLEETAGGFKIFLYYLYRHLQASELPDEMRRSRVRNSTRRMRMFDLPPGYRVFRSYHMITGRDIVDNKIHASMAEMYNSCLVRAPVEPLSYRKEDKEFVETEGDDEDIVIEHDDTDWRSYPTSDGIAFNSRTKKANRKLGVVYEMNAVSTDQKAKALMSNMGILLAPMYRGELTVIGRNIRPWDVVYLNDPENEMRGHFEVASVTHHLDASVGWVSVIEPHAFIRVNNPTSELQLAFAQGLLRGLEPFIDLIDAGLMVMTIAGIAGSIFTGGASLSATAGASALRGVVAGTGRVALKLAAKQTVLKGLQSFSKRAVFKFAVKEGASSTALALRTGTVAAADAVTIGLTPQAQSFLSMLGHIGRFAGSNRGIALALGLTGAFYGADAYTSVYAKQQVASTNLPVDVHFLLYRGARLQAGMDLEDEDIYSLYEKFLGLASDTVSTASDMFYDAWAEIAGDGMDGNPVMQMARGE